MFGYPFKMPRHTLLEMFTYGIAKNHTYVSNAGDTQDDVATKNAKTIIKRAEKLVDLFIEARSAHEAKEKDDERQQREADDAEYQKREAAREETAHKEAMRRERERQTKLDLIAAKKKSAKIRK